MKKLTALLLALALCLGLAACGSSQTPASGSYRLRFRLRFCRPVR